MMGMKMGQMKMAMRMAMKMADRRQTTCCQFDGTCGMVSALRSREPDREDWT